MVLAFTMLWPVTSSASCWARMPRRVVSSPRNVESGICLHPRVDQVEDLGPGRGAAGGRVRTLGRAREYAHQVVEEGELLADQHPVLAVDAGRLGEHPAKLCGEVPGPDRVAGRQEHEDHLEREVGGRAAQGVGRLVE